MLLSSQLHSALSEPFVEALNFLNEIARQFPQAISFAPGAPYPTYLMDINVEYYLNQYIQYLCNHQNLSHQQAHEMVYQYGPAKGIINELVARKLKNDDNIHINADDLLITVGVQEAMLVVLRTLIRSPQETLAVITPCYLGILGAARILDLNVINIDENSQGIDLAELDRICTTARQNNQAIRLLYVAPDYANPSGTLLDLTTRHQLLQLADKHDFYLLEDSTYAFTAPPEEKLPSLKALDKVGRVIFLGSFAKICLPGARVGYVVADQTVKGRDKTTHPLARDLAAIKSLITLNTSPICQALIGGLLIDQDCSLAAFIEERATFYRKNLLLLLNSLERRLCQNKLPPLGITWNKPSGGFFVRMQLPIAVDMKLLTLCAKEFGIIWTPMSSFYLNNNKGNRELRLSCSYLTSTQIEEGVDRLANFLQSIVGEFRYDNAGYQT